MVKPARIIDFTLADIEQSAREHLVTTKRRPIKRSGDITVGPLKDKGLNWGWVFTYFRTEKPEGHTSFSGFMDEKDIISPSKKPSLDDVEESARAKFRATGKRPSKLDQDIEHGPLKGTGEKWANINAAFKLDVYSGFKSLAEFLDSRNVGIRRFTPHMIEQSMRATMDATGVSMISRNSGAILHGPLKAYKTTWDNIHFALKHGHSGLKKCGFYSLKELREARNIQPTLHILFKDMADITRDLQTPTALTATFQKAAAHKIRTWDSLLEKDAIKGWAFFMPSLTERPKSSMEFCLATGLVRQDGEKLVYAGERKIKSITRAVLATRASSAP